MVDKWTGASTASRFKHQVFYALIKIGGRRLAYILLYFVVAFYTLVPKFRKTASPYIDKMFMPKNFFEKFRHCYKLFLTFGKTLVDRAAFGISGEIEILSSKEDKDLVKTLHAKNKGLIIITAHAGAWASAMSSFDFVDGKKYVLYKRNDKDVDKQAHEHGRTKQTVNFIDPTSYGGGSFEILSALEKKGIVCVMGDREFGSPRNKIETPFLGANIALPSSIYRIAAASGAPILVIFFPFMGAGKLSSVVADNFYVEDKGPKISAYKPEAARFALAFEKFVKQYPYQYFNFYDIWRKDDKNFS
ncbi:MAG: lysophospholipid acyltransferase family protein [Elusimicrobiota bacterium]|nr:lysophospholipid acyltransferase family protein [Elusimicrobiota bacterium]